MKRFLLLASFFAFTFTVFAQEEDASILLGIATTSGGAIGQLSTNMEIDWQEFSTRRLGYLGLTTDFSIKLMRPTEASTYPDGHYFFPKTTVYLTKRATRPQHLYGVGLGSLGRLHDEFLVSDVIFSVFSEGRDQGFFFWEACANFTAPNKFWEVDAEAGIHFLGFDDSVEFRYSLIARGHNYLDTWIFAGGEVSIEIWGLGRYDRTRSRAGIDASIGVFNDGSFGGKARAYRRF